LEEIIFNKFFDEVARSLQLDPFLFGKVTEDKLYIKSILIQHAYSIDMSALVGSVVELAQEIEFIIKKHIRNLPDNTLYSSRADVIRTIETNIGLKEILHEQEIKNLCDVIRLRNWVVHSYYLERKENKDFFDVKLAIVQNLMLSVLGFMKNKLTRMIDNKRNKK